MCKNGECIDYHKLCNGIPDCEDGSDEDVKGQRPECKSKTVQFAYLIVWKLYLYFLNALFVHFLPTMNLIMYVVLVKNKILNSNINIFFKVRGILSRFD